jgi:ATP-binding cassette, subfamily B, multidrug efflux pump
VSTARKKIRSVAEDVSFGKAYDARLVKRLAVFFKPHVALLVVTMISYPAVAGLHLIQPYLIKVALDEHLVPKKLDGFGTVIVALIGALFLEFIAKFAQTYLSQLLGQRVTRDLRLTLFKKLQEVDLSYIEKNPVGRLMTRVTNDVESLAETFSTGAISIIGDFVLLSGAIVMMLALDVELTLYSFTVLPLLIGLMLIMRNYAREAFRKVRSHLARINGFLNEAISGMSLIQVFRQERAMEDEFREINGEYRDANFAAIRYDAITYAAVEAVATIAVALLLLLGWRLFERGQVEIGLFVAFIEYLRRFFAPITELSTKYTVMQSAMASAERCVDLLDQTPTVLEPTGPRPDRPFSDAIRFEGVSFRYGAGPDILHGLELTIRRGERVAIVGPTGSGKSTIVKLIARFYDPRDGRVTIDGDDLRELRLDELRGKIAVVLQDSYLIDGSIADNIAFGDRTLPREVMIDAAERTRAIEVVHRQEQGWDAKVGERGSRLSAGERQLIAFARALALDPEILVLDEATSSVDPETESLIQRGLEALISDRTALIVAHRLSTVRSADRIVVLVAGRVVEEGSHDELMAKGGVYRKLVELQFADGPTEMPEGAQPAEITA